MTPHFVGVEIVVLDTGRHEPCLILGSEEILYKNIGVGYSRKSVAIGWRLGCRKKLQGKTATSRYNTKHQSEGEQRVLTDSRPPNVRTPTLRCQSSGRLQGDRKVFGHR